MGTSTSRGSIPVALTAADVRYKIRVALLAARGWTLDSFADSTFYSDSLNDLPLLCKVKTPVAANPDAVLRAHAEQHGWRIISLR